MQAFYADHFVLPLPAGHRFPMSKYERLRNRLVAECPGIRLAEALPASDGELALVHTPRYVSAVAQGHLSAAEQREIGFPWSLRMAERARRSVGATSPPPALPCSTSRALPPTWPVAPTTRKPTRAAATVSSMTWRWLRG